MKKVVLAVGSSISAYKSCDLARLFVKGGYNVYVALTDNAAKLVSPLALEALTGNPVYTNATLWEKREMGHIALKDGASLFLAAPATANMIGKFANGIADDLVSTTFLALECPALIAPAMNPNMYASPAVKMNRERLAGWGVKFIEPETGLVACGDEGKGRLADINTIYEAACNVIEGK
ncbi:MAG TPA: flavoprotein [Spirochaetota bacterium]|nr:flavoprotein [Spirochaetota bacterium]HPJ35356.1 flavoprotein [Spirochaetota bacterium]